MKKILAYGAAAMFLFAASASHAETAGKGPHLISGDKSYQNIGKAAQDDNASNRPSQKSGDAQSVSQIEPAAGAATGDSEAASSSSQGSEKPLHEQMRLPQKSF